MSVLKPGTELYKCNIVLKRENKTVGYKEPALFRHVKFQIPSQQFDSCAIKFNLFEFSLEDNIS